MFTDMHSITLMTFVQVFKNLLGLLSHIVQQESLHGREMTKASIAFTVSPRREPYGDWKEYHQNHNLIQTSTYLKSCTN